MEKLSSALRRLRLELEAGLASSEGTAAVTLSLALEPNHPEPTWCLAEPTSGQTSLHSVTIQFQLGSRTTHAPEVIVSKPSPAPTPTPTSTPTPGDSERPVADQCVSIFGPPGFDNAARAEVFCELVTHHAQAELNDALDAIGSPSTHPSAASALTSRLRQLLGFAPVGREAAAARLRALLDQHPPGDLQRIIAARWRFGTHWGTAADGFSV